MKNHLSSNDGNEYQSSGTACYWWRTDAKFDELQRHKLDLPHTASFSPRLKVLRELERLALFANGGLNELRYKLQMYGSGDLWVPTGGIRKEKMDIPHVITILLVGFAGSGKSSLVNLMYSVLGRRGALPFAQTSSGDASSYTTMCLEEHNVLRSMNCGFCVYDSRGFRYEKLREELEELSNWMSDGVHHNQLCLKSGDDDVIKRDPETVGAKSSSKFVQRRVNCVMVVVNLAEVYRALKAGDFKPIEAVTQLYKCPALRQYNENPLLILTHGDLLTTEQRIEGRVKICEILGVPANDGVYDIVCLTEYGYFAEESDPITAYALTEVVYRALLFSDRKHSPKKNLWEKALPVLSWLMCLIGVFLAFLATVCSAVMCHMGVLFAFLADVCCKLVVKLEKKACVLVLQQPM